MTESAEILALLTALFLLEGTYWTRPAATILASSLGGAFRVRVAARDALLANPRSAWVFGHAVPWGASIHTEPWAVSLSPEGVFAHVSSAPFADTRPEQSDRFAAFGAIRNINSDGTALRVDGSHFCKLATAPAAAATAERLRTVARLEPAKRADAIDAMLAGDLDEAAVRKRFVALVDGTAGLRRTCTLLMAYLVAALLGTAYAVWARWEIGLFELVLGYLGLVSVAAGHYVLVHRRLCPHDKAERSRHLWTMMVSPADAMHSADSFLRHAFVGRHPLAVVAAVCPRADFETYARTVWLDLVNPLPAEGEPPAAAATAVRDWFDDRARHAVHAFLVRCGLDPSAWPAPLPEEPECRSYCPRCGTQYERAGIDCLHCRLPVRTFEQPASSWTPARAPVPPPLEPDPMPAKPEEPEPVDAKPDPKPADAKPEPKPVAAPVSQPKVETTHPPKVKDKAKHKRDRKKRRK